MNAATTHKGGLLTNNSSASGANYFFGVLFAFAVIVLSVIACGIASSRRSSSRRRRALRHQSWGSLADTTKGEVEPPRFYETGYKVVQDAGWKAMMVRSGHLFFLFRTYMPSSYDSAASVGGVSW